MNPIAPDETFQVLDGVHRCVAAIEAGLPGVLARVFRGGQPSFLAVVDVDRVYSTKSSIRRRDKNRDFFDLVHVMSSPEGRAGIEPVTLEPISSEFAAKLVSLTDVVVIDD